MIDGVSVCSPKNTSTTQDTLFHKLLLGLAVVAPDLVMYGAYTSCPFVVS